ncbi:MAG: hypothetical protein WA081_05415 [Desulfosalsimonadaceae bacterium]
MKTNVIEFPKERIIRRTSITYDDERAFIHPRSIKKLYVKPQGADAWEQWVCYGSADGKSSFWGPADLFDSEGKGNAL